MSKSKEKIIGFARKRGLKIKDLGDDGFLTEYESNIVNISCDIFHGTIKEEIVSFTCMIVIGCPVDTQLLARLVGFSGRCSTSASLILIKDGILAKWTMLGGKHIDEDNFFTMLSSVAVISNSLDMSFRSSYGCQSGVDFVRDSLREKDGNNVEW